MRSGRRSRADGEAIRSRAPRSTVSPQHVEWMWRTWRQREERRAATPDEVRELPAVEDEPSISASLEAEDVPPSRRQRRLRREPAERLITPVDGLWEPPAAEEEPPLPPGSGAEEAGPSRREDPSAADRRDLPTGRPAKRASLPLRGRLLDPRIIGLALIGVVVASAPYALQRLHDGIGRDARLEPLGQEAPAGRGSTALPGGTADTVAALDDQAHSATPRGEPEAGAALVERLFTFRYGDGLRAQELTLDGCDVVVADMAYDARSGARERLDLARFELRRFHPIDADTADRLLLAADADADQDLLLWYDALAEATRADAEGWVQTMIARADAGEFGGFLARNRHETQALSSDGAETPFPRPLLQVSIRLPQNAAAAAASAWRAYVRDHCASG